MSIQENLNGRGRQRAKYLEDPRYRRLSDVINEYSREYRLRAEVSMLGAYLGDKRCISRENLKKLINKNLDNPNINWRGLYLYLDERIESAKQPMNYIIKEECYKLRDVLEPYRKRFQSTFVGF